jgi:hypothetical protein
MRVNRSSTYSYIEEEDTSSQTGAKACSGVKRTRLVKKQEDTSSLSESSENSNLERPEHSKFNFRKPEFSSSDDSGEYVKRHEHFGKEKPQFPFGLKDTYSTDSTDSSQEESVSPPPPKFPPPPKRSENSGGLEALFKSLLDNLSSTDSMDESDSTESSQDELEALFEVLKEKIAEFNQDDSSTQNVSFYHRHGRDRKSEDTTTTSNTIAVV